MIKVVLIGAGNVAVHMAKAMLRSEHIELIQRFSRNDHNNEFFDSKIPKTNSIEELKQADLYLIAINDDSIEPFSEQLEFKQGLVAHTSGSMRLDALKCLASKGVCYPVQTFSKNETLDYGSIPFCLEAENVEDLELLKSFAGSISKNVYEINSNQRQKLHLAAVFSNNFSNHMFKIGQDICNENGFSFDILKPLLIETVEKLKTLTPFEAQTGPARRNDQKVIQQHIKELSGDQKEIYKIITHSIIKTYKSD